MSTNEMNTSSIKQLSPAQKLARLVFGIALAGLIVTGIPQKFMLEGWADLIITMLGGIESVRILHRFFVIVLMFAVSYHVIEVGYSWFVLRKRPGWLPSLRDWRMQFSRIASNFGAGDQDTRDFSAPLKIEYLVIVLSVIILGVTGAILLNPILVSDILPGTVIPFSRSVHSDHALLFTGFIIFWRIGILFWQPKRVESIETNEQDSAQIAQRRRVYSIISVVVIVAFAGLIYAYMTYETTAISIVARQEVLVFAPEFVPEEGNPDIGELVWLTQRCSFCHGVDANGIDTAPALPTENLTLDAFVVQVRNGSGQMPAFSSVELPDSYLAHLWAWLESLP